MLHLIGGALYGFHHDELLTYRNARDFEGDTSYTHR